MKLLIVADYFLPGHKAGGPIISLKYLANYLNNKIELKVLTRSRDLNSKKNYSNLILNQWIIKNNFPIFYAVNNYKMINQFCRVIFSRESHYIYINSLFSFWYSVSLLTIIFLFRKHKQHKVILAPRGELLDGALEFKKLRKQLYLKFFNIFFKDKIYKWHATSIIESKSIEMHFNVENIFKIPNLYPQIFENKKTNDYKDYSDETLKCIYLSRITPKKNLLFLIKLLQRFKKFDLIFDIYGPLEDFSYWEECRKEILNLPQNIKIQYRGEVKHENIKNTFNRYDLFLFPSKSENHGHVIYESLSSGTCVFVSNNICIPDSLKEIVFSLTIKDEKVWIDNLKKIHLEKKKFLRDKNYIINIYNNYIRSTNLHNKYNILFDIK
jgi:glycosyltransferase involved in cell wall biosynthesis